jgi:hypothetical protein
VCPVKKFGAKWWLARIGLVLGGCLIGLFIAEGLARLVAPAGHADLLFNSPDSSPQGLYVNDPELLLVPNAGFTATVQSLDYDVSLQINSMGLRGPELDPSASHWLALGDSFTIAVQVSEEDSFSGQLSAATGSTFLNAGVDGYSTWQALLRYQNLVEQGVDLDGVLLTFFLGNDFHDNDRFEVMARQASQLEAGRPIPRAPLPWLQRILMRHSVLYAHLRVWMKAQNLKAGRDPDRDRWRQELSIFSSEGNPQLNHLSTKTTQALQALKKATDANGDALLIALAPPAFVVDDSRLQPTFEIVGLEPATASIYAPGQRALNLMSELGITTCDLTEALRQAQEEGEDLYFAYDGHWTPAGHRVVSETVQACMEDLN